MREKIGNNINLSRSILTETARMANKFEARSCLDRHNLSFSPENSFSLLLASLNRPPRSRCSRERRRGEGDRSRWARSAWHHQGIENLIKPTIFPGSISTLQRNLQAGGIHRRQRGKNALQDISSTPWKEELNLL
ncbi:hypothetical protein OIU76_003109 [Salix suchowensis]|nr:hypothetical protein OIU76_003109 [Salix suchowensis]